MINCEITKIVIEEDDHDKDDHKGGGAAVEASVNFSQLIALLPDMCVRWGTIHIIILIAILYYPRSRHFLLSSSILQYVCA